jgi:hypothetical protein
MEYKFINETNEPITIIDGHFFECFDPDCIELIEPTNTWPEFTCELDECYGGNFGYGDYYKIIITFSDGISRESNIFEKKHYNAEYIVTIYPNSLYVEEISLNFRSLEIRLATCCFGMLLLLGLLISIGVLVRRGKHEQQLEDTSSRWIITIWVIGGLILLGSLFLWDLAELHVLSLPLTVLIEGGIIIAYFSYRKQPWKILSALNLSGNLITQILLLIIISLFSATPQWGAIILAEGLIIVMEALILFWPQRRQVSFRDMLALSFILNLASFTIGLFLPI